MKTLLSLIVLLSSLSALAQSRGGSYVTAQSRGGSTLCYMADRAGNAFGSAVDNELCRHSYTTAQSRGGATLCYMADRNGVAYGSAVENYLCQGGGRPEHRERPPVRRPRREVTCDRDNSVMFQRVFQQMKSLAYSTAGLNLSAEAAIDFAHDWTATNPCSRAPRYEQDLKRLKSFAYSTRGLNYSNDEANRYALSRIDFVCTNLQYETIYASHFSFAYGTSGLNLSAADARDYALPRFEDEAMVCDNR